MRKRFVLLLLSFLLIFPLLGLAEAAQVPGPEGMPPREELIDRMFALAKQLYDKANGRPQRAHYAGDIYVCKNFTVHLFTQCAGDYRMAEFPDLALKIPNNLNKAKSKPYAYGISWEEMPADKGNPFVEAASFHYDSKLSKKENREKALAFLREAKKGDFFQMSAAYRYGIGAHSAVILEDYNAESDSLTWTDSNMNGISKNGLRFGYVQYGANKPIDWFADAFCKKTRGATLYRLRDDIIRR